MPPKARPAELTLDVPAATKDQSDSPGPNTSPIGVDLSSFGGEFSGNLTTLPPLPSSPPPPPSSPRHQRDPSKNFFGIPKSRIPPEQEQWAQVRQVKDEDDAQRPGSGSMSKIYHLRKNPGSTPELSLVGSAESVGKQAEDVNNPQPEVRPQSTPHHSGDGVASRRKDGNPFRIPLGRSKSIRRDSHSKSTPNERVVEQPPKTAPLASEFPDKDMGLLRAKGKARRGKSAERAVASESDENVSQTKQKSVQQQAREKENHAKSGFMSGSKNVMKQAKTGGGAFLTRLGKIGRSGSNTGEKEIPDSEYVLKVINLPLVEQTRMTRISKDLGSCRDKTEFWMPSLPWRCIDYLNLNCESEGLYRIPGSGPQVKHWQRRFDSEGDVDLLDEQDLYDPNTIGSMLKSWLRDLPTEIMPKSQQSALAKEIEKDNPDYQRVGQPAPQKLRDALSDLSPFNYYLLFAITCHLSLLLSHKEKNKMDLHNLNICIGPPLNLERWLFNYLVGDWRHCWQGCFTEKQYLESEMALEYGRAAQVPGSRGEERITTGTQSAIADDRAVSSSGSGSGASHQASHYEDATSGVHEDSQGRLFDSPRPETYKPAGSASLSRPMNGNARALQQQQQLSPPAVGQDIKRPSTAEVMPGEGGLTDTLKHNRAKSDLPGSPVQRSADSEPALPTPGGRS